MFTGAVALLPSAARASETLELVPTNWVHVGINFVILLALIYPVQRWLLGPIARVLQQREEQTEGAQGQVTGMREECAALATQVETELRQARSAAQTARLDTLAKADEQERHILERAREDAGRTLAALRESIAAELESARGQIEHQAATLGKDVATKLLGRAL